MQKIEMLGPDFHPDSLDSPTRVNTPEQMPRTVTINIDAEALQELRGKVGSIAIRDAIGYLSLWNMNHPNVTIYSDGGKDLLAAYSRADNTREYVIGAHWDGAEYSFNS